MNKKVTVGTFTVTPVMRALVEEVLATERISYGPMCRKFERQLAEIHECKFGVLSNSGTSSLQVALQAMKELYHWPDDAEVIVPSVTFVATLNVVLHNNLKPIIVDVEPDYYGLNPDYMRQAITSKTRAIIPVHLFGMPCDMRNIMAALRGRGLKVIEDSCECMFVEHRGRMVGSWGDVGCFSTYVAHLITTGVGGMAVTNDEELAVRMRSLVNHGRDAIYTNIDDDNGLNNTELKEVVNRRLRFNSVGHSFRITELEAALGLGQLLDWEMMISRRQRNAQYLTEKLMRHAEHLQLPRQRLDTGHAFMMYPVVVKGAPKWDLVHHLEANGIETREMLPLTNQPAYQDWIDENRYPVANWINKSGLYCGIHQDLTLEDLDYMVDVFNTFYS